MVQLTRIYTRGGDKGRTSLGDGTRVDKHSLRVEAYGTVDELNAIIGIARLQAEGEIDSILGRVQNELFDLGADLCTPGDGTSDDPDAPRLRMIDSQVERLETEIDARNVNLAPLTSFILPGGSPLAANLHHARTVARRAERFVCALSEIELINPVTVRYLNRLSDLLFVVGRIANDGGKTDILWTPGATR